MKHKLTIGLSSAVILALLVTALALADNLKNDVVAGGNDTFTAGGSTKIKYWIQPTGNTCDAADGTPATITINVPSGVTASPSTLTFSACNTQSEGDPNNTQEVTFSSSTAGDYSITATASDNNGNYNTTPANFTLHVLSPTPSDTTPPVISYVLTPASPDGDNGWYKSNVTLVWSVTDPESAVTKTGCVDQNITADQAATTYSCSATSAGGSSGPVSVTIKRDATPPTISASVSPERPSTGWWNKVSGAPTVSFSCSDATSGVVACPEDYTFGEGADQSHSETIYDNAGNSASAGVSDIDVDLTAPTISASVSPARPASGWWNIASGAPTVSFTCSDTGGSGLAGSCPAPFTFGEGADQSRSETIYDNAGNSASAGVSDIDVDLTAPTISASVSPARPASGWWNKVSGAPTLSFTCYDATSGVASCPGAHTFGEGENQAYSGTAYDNAGNSASAGVNNIDVDLTAPTLTWNGGPADGGTYYFGFVPAAPTCTASDELSGPNGCNVTGYSVTVGSHTMTATALDLAGNSTEETRSYTVLAWRLSGFYQPVDMGGVYNLVKNGSTVPLKFEIFAGATELTDTGYVKSLTYAQTDCNAATTADEIETVATGGTSLRYDATAGQFVYNWKTPNTAGKCYRVTMTTQDGSSLVAYFKLK